MSTDCIEILLASYNGAPFIREQLDSILSQTECRWHLTLSDDGSTDGTDAILDEYVFRYPDKMARVRSGIRFGNARDHFFWLIRQCDTELMMTCDQDDVWYPEKVQVTLEALEQAQEQHGKQEPLLVFTDLAPVDAALGPVAPSLMRLQKQDASVIDYRRILLQNIVTGCAMGFNRALADLAALCSDASEVIMHDWWMAAVAARFGRVIYLDHPTIAYRQHGDNSVGAKDVSSLGYIVQKISKPVELRRLIMRKKRQAKRFLLDYEGRLTEEDRRFLRIFTRSHSGPLFYLRNRSLFYGFMRFAGALLLG